MPQAGKTVLGIAMTLLILSIITIPFQTPISASYIVNILALLVSIIFLVLVIILIYKKIIG